MARAHMPMLTASCGGTSTIAGPPPAPCLLRSVPAPTIASPPRLLRNDRPIRQIGSGAMLGGVKTRRNRFGDCRARIDRLIGEALEPVLERSGDASAHELGDKGVDATAPARQLKNMYRRAGRDRLA